MCSRLYYAEKFRHLVEAALTVLETSGGTLDKKARFNFVKKRTKEIYEAQPEDIKAEVRQEIEKHAAALKEPEDGAVPTPRTI